MNNGNGVVRELKDVVAFVENYCAVRGSCSAEFQRDFGEEVDRVLSIVHEEYGARGSDNLDNLDSGAELGSRSYEAIKGLRSWVSARLAA